MTKEEEIQKLIDLPMNEPTLDESKIENLSTEKSTDKDLLFTDEPIEIKSGTNKQEEAKEAKKEIKEEAKEEDKKEVKEENKEEVKDNPIQEGGLMKKIYVTDLSVDKDKEMFQM